MRNQLEQKVKENDKITSVHSKKNRNLEEFKKEGEEMKKDQSSLNEKNFQLMEVVLGQKAIGEFGIVIRIYILN